MFASMTYDFVNQTKTSSPTEYASAPTLQNSNKSTTNHGLNLELLITLTTIVVEWCYYLSNISVWAVSKH